MSSVPYRSSVFDWLVRIVFTGFVVLFGWGFCGWLIVDAWLNKGIDAGIVATALLGSTILLVTIMCYESMWEHVLAHHFASGQSLSGWH